MTSATFTDLTAAEARERLVRGDFTAEAYVKACLDAVEAREAEIQAWVHVDREHALEQARAADRVRAAGRPMGALHGLPVGIKDIIDTADMPTQNGSPIHKDRRPAQDAACVSQIRSSGGIVIGKTVTTELANTTPNKTRNPHNPAHTPGGSSSGSAAAIGAGTIPLALGTQTGGSVIRPASYCGAYAMKPTLGLISRTGATLQSHTLDTIGVYGRGIADLALIADALSAQDPQDAVSYERAAPRIAHTLAAGLPGAPRFAFVKSPAWPQGEAEAQQALSSLVERLGGAVDEVAIGELEGVIEHHTSVMGAENVLYYGPLLAEHPDEISPNLAARLRQSSKIPATAYLRALQDRDAMYGAVARVLGSYAAIVTLPATGPAPEGFATTGNAVFNAMWTYLGVPCVTLPLMQVRGLPLGVQLIGKRRNEGHLLAAARWLEMQIKG